MSGEAPRSKLFARAAAPVASAPTPAASAVAAHVQLQSVTRVSSPRDPAEREAEAMAKRVVRLPAESPSIARFASSVPLIARKAERGPQITPALAGEISQSAGSGSPLPASTRQFMEARFGADFRNVRVHTSERAAKLSRQLNAQAFTVGNQIFFGKGRFQPESSEGRELIAHELTHTIQQGEVVQRSAELGVHERSATEVQRLGVSDALDYFADAANNIPGYRMFTILLGVNPINMSRVERSAANILRAVVEFIPGGGLITRALDNHGVFDRVGNWVEEQLRTLGITGSSIREAIDRFLDSLSWTDIFHLGSVWDRAKRIFTDPIDRILGFVRNLASAILRFIRDAILRPLAALASRTRAWDLLCAVMGQNPITGEPVPRNAETLIGGFMKLIGQEEIWENIKRGNAIARAWAWFQGALGALLGFVRQIPGLFVQALQALEIEDLVLLPRAFERVASVFGGFLANFVRWAGDAVWSLLEIIFSVVAPGVMVYLQRARAAFRTILRDPIAFVRNLVRAAMQGFRQFATNFLTHLRAALIGWLTGAMSGANIYIPQAFTLQEVLKFVLSVLGLTWQNIRQKLVRAVGETTVAVLERGFDIVVTLVTQGPAAAWQKILESLTNLRELVIEQLMSFVRERVVEAAVTRLLSMLSPAGAFIQAIIATYNTVMFFVERLRQIAQVAASFIDSISAIAGGVIAAAANRVEQTMAGLLTLVISFLARIAGLGRVSDAVTEVINRVRQPIDRGLDRVVEWIVSTARRLGRFIAQAGVPQDPQQRVRLALAAGTAVARRLSGRVTRSLLDEAVAVVRVRYGLQELRAFTRAGTIWLRARINPEEEGDTGAVEGESAESDLAKVRGAYPDQPFTTGDVARVLATTLRTAQRRVSDWVDRNIFLVPGTRSYTFVRPAATTAAAGEHRSIYVDKATWEVLPRYVIRDWFYKKNYRQTRIADVLTKADTGRLNSKNEKLYTCAGGWGPNHIPFPTRAELELDHEPDVSAHWNDGVDGGVKGRATIQLTRNDWYDDPTHLRVLCHSCNESKRKGTYIRRVEEGFRGPNDNP